MRPRATWPLCLAVTVAGCQNEAAESDPRFDPPTVIAHAQCDATATEPPLSTDCAGSFPGGVFTWAETSACHFTHEGCRTGHRQEICQEGKSLAFPDCAPTAEVSGFGSRVEDADLGGDGDLVFDICPEAQAVILDPSSTPPRIAARELRAAASFAVMDGRMHIEVQSCRFCRGTWEFPEAPGTTFDNDVHDGDRVAASGNWVVDAPQHEGWSEIHEATAIAVVRTLPPAPGGLPNAVSYILVNAFFVDSPDQRDDLVLDVRVPTPAESLDASFAARLACTVDPPLLQRGCPCATPAGVHVDAVADDAGWCRLRIHRDAAAPPPLPFVCVNTPPCLGGPFSVATGACANI
ncbi:MAG: hypothetical protein ACXVCV_21610, partial [Polyangia bacterium]